MKQRSVMVWFTGLSGSGKSTVAIALERELHKCGLLCRILDGDNIRSGINNNLGFSAEDRVENIRRIAEVSKLFIDTGVITIAAFISPNNDLREMAASIVGKENFLEIYVSTPIEECERRDVKGLYAKARRGEIKDFTGTYSEYVAWKREYEAARHAQEAQARPKPQAVRTQAAFYPHFLEPRLAPGEELTPTELQILHLLCADKSNAEIAQIMDVKLPTVKTHVSHILDKLDVKRRAEAKTAAKKLHLVPDNL